MSVLRKRTRSHFTILPNAAVRDPRLSFRAVGCLAYMLSLPDGSTISAEAMAAFHSPETRRVEGRKAVLTALGELRDAGYYRTTRVQTRGRWSTIVDLRDSTEVPWEDSGTESPSPAVGAPDSGEGLSLEETLEETVETPYGPPSGDGQTALVLVPPPMQEPRTEAIDRAFAGFWSVYPRRTATAAARRAYTKAIASLGCKRDVQTRDVDAAAAIIYAGAVAFRDDPNRSEAHTPHPSTWLNQGRWADDPLPPRAAVPGDALTSGLAALRGARS